MQVGEARWPHVPYNIELEITKKYSAVFKHRRPWSLVGWGQEKGEKMSNWTISRVLKVKHRWAWWEIGWVTDNGDYVQSFFFLSFSYFFHTVKALYKDKNFFFSFSTQKYRLQADLPRNQVISAMRSWNVWFLRTRWNFWPTAMKLATWHDRPIRKSV